MNVLLVTADENVLREGSAARKAVMEYATLATHLFVIVLNSGKRWRIQRISEKLWIYPSNAWSLWSAPIAAARVAGRELWFQNRLQVDLVCALDPCESALASFFIVRFTPYILAPFAAIKAILGFSSAEDSALAHAQRRAGFSGKPLQVHMEHDVLNPYMRDESFGALIRSMIARFVLPQASKIRITSERMLESLEELSPEVAKRAFILPRFVDRWALAHEPVRIDIHEKFPRFRFILLMVAPLLRDENLSLGLHVLVGVAHHFARTGLVIVGEGPERRHLKRLARRLGVEDRLVIEPMSSNYSSYYKTANVFLYTGLNGNTDVLREAAACSALIVAPKIGAAPTFIKDGINGFLCDPEKPESFVRTIVEVLERPGVREKIKLNLHAASENREGEDKREFLRKLHESWEQMAPQVV